MPETVQLAHSPLAGEGLNFYSVWKRISQVVCQSNFSIVEHEYSIDHIISSFTAIPIRLVSTHYSNPPILIGDEWDVTGLYISLQSDDSPWLAIPTNIG